MKRIVSAAVAMVVGLAIGNGVAMASEAGGGTEVAVGLKSWVNSWERKAPEGGSDSTNTIMLMGPSVEAEFSNHIFAEAAILFSTSDYELSDDQNYDRRDIDVAVGYSFNHYVGAFVGYRDSSFEESSSDEKETSYGPFLGVRGSVPVTEAFSVYGKVTYLYTRLKVEGGAESGTEDSPGWIGELGVKYAFTKQLGADLGYKYETNEGDDSDVSDTFTGLTVGVTYTFE